MGKGKNLCVCNDGKKCLLVDRTDGVSGVNTTITITLTPFLWPHRLHH
jgi:hypothetical protein